MPYTTSCHRALVFGRRGGRGAAIEGESLRAAGRIPPCAASRLLFPRRARRLPRDLAFQAAGRGPDRAMKGCGIDRARHTGSKRCGPGLGGRLRFAAPCAVRVRCLGLRCSLLRSAGRGPVVLLLRGGRGPIALLLRGGRGPILYCCCAAAAGLVEEQELEGAAAGRHLK